MAVLCAPQPDRPFWETVLGYIRRTDTRTTMGTMEPAQIDLQPQSTRDTLSYESKDRSKCWLRMYGPRGNVPEALYANTSS